MPLICYSPFHIIICFLSTAKSSSCAPSEARIEIPHRSVFVRENCGAITVLGCDTVVTIVLERHGFQESVRLEVVPAFHRYPKYYLFVIRELYECVTMTKICHVQIDAGQRWQ